MASSKPIIRQVAWISLVPQLLIMIFLIFFFNLFIDPFHYALNIAMLFYLGASFLLRSMVPRNHRKGIRLFKSGDYTQAVSEFEKSYDFFMRHPWVDKYRFIVLLSSSRISYREMALVNVAFCYAQMGNGKKAIACYERALQQFPDSELAKSALKMLYSIQD